MFPHKKNILKTLEESSFYPWVQALWRRWRKSGFFYSVLLHGALFLLLCFGVPSLPRPMTEIPVVFVEFAPVGKLTQSPSQKKRAPSKKTSPVKKPKAPVVEEEAQPLPARTAPREEAKPAPAPSPDKVPIKNAEKDLPPEPKKEEKKEEVLRPEKTVDSQEPPKPEKKEEKTDPSAAVIDKSKRKSAKSEEEPKKKKKKKIDFSKLMDSVTKLDGSEDAIEEHQEVHGDKSAPAATLGDKLSISEEDAVRRQIESCWNVPTGAKNAHAIVVEIRISTNPDGSVREARIVEQSRLSDPFFRAMAESAQRAVLTASPLKLPPHKYAQWRVFTMNFNPRDMY